jgi:hypothetical protein
MNYDNKVIANRKNAKASSGPRSTAGKRRASRNAVRHGLAVDVDSDPAWHDGVEVLTKILCLTQGGQRNPERCREAARAAIEQQRIRQIRTRVLNKLSTNRGAVDYHSNLNDVLAISRRKRAFKFVDAD